MNKDNEYKTICDKCGKRTWYEVEQPCHMTIYSGCEACGSRECVQNEAKCTGTLRIIDNSMLSPMLTPFYNSGERVEVEYMDGEKERFYVGKSTGWKPVYLEIKKRNSMGGGMIMLDSERVKSIRGVGVFM